MWTKPIELPHLAVGAPAEIAVPPVPYIGVGNALDAARRVESCSHLVGHAFVLHETMLAGRANGLLLKAMASTSRPSRRAISADTSACLSAKVGGYPTKQPPGPPPTDTKVL
jgi:hypothetical protein